ncbi:MAG TPA: MFS transporter [Geminicoccaceae bacterium]|nr:MFS transporter [Geminicoccaceae bacterium]
MLAALRSRNPVIAARHAVSLVFFVNGTGMGLWAGHIPVVRTGLGLSEGALGVALLLMAMGAMLTMPAMGWLTGRFGSRACTIAAGIAFVLLLAAPLFAASWGLLLATTLLLGAANGAMDVAMNTQAAAVQRAWGQAIMSSFHAFFSLGGLAGAAVAAGLLAVSDAPRVHMTLMALLLAAVLALGTRRLHADRGSGGGGFVLPSRAALMLGGLALLAILAEGAMLDWSAVYLADVLAAGPSLAVMGFAAFSAAMTIGRLTGDRVVRRLGDRWTLVGSGLIAATGLALAFVGTSTGLAVLGFGLAGIGLANTVPILFSAGARIPGVAPGMGVAMVATLGYAGGLAGPALIGFAAEAVGLRVALSLLVLSCVVVALAALKGYAVAGRPAPSPH